MSQNNSRFVHYYDLLFANKGYREEVNYLLSLYKHHANRKLVTILDVGCGTGNHTLEFFRRGYDIIGIDIDVHMLQKARSKVKEGRKIFRKHDIAHVQLQGKFDFAFSWFFVVNYISQLTYLEKYFQGISKSLRRGGLFIFDAWNGNAVVHDPPKVKSIKMVNGDIAIRGSLTPDYSTFLGTADFHYHLVVTHAGRVHRLHNIVPQTYWTPFILKQLALSSGFLDVVIYPHLSKKANVSNNNYKLTYVCKK